MLMIGGAEGQPVLTTKLSKDYIYEDACEDLREWTKAGHVLYFISMDNQYIGLVRMSISPASFIYLSASSLDSKSANFFLQFDLDFTFLVFLISHGNPKMITVPRKSKT